MINKKNIPYGIIIVLVIVIAILSKCNSNLKEESFIANNNIEVVNDSLIKIEGKYGESIAERGVLITDMKGLKTLNNELYKDIKKLKTSIPNMKPQVVIKYETKIVHDTISIENSIASINDSLHKVIFGYDTTYTGTNSRKLEGTALIQLVYNDSNKYNSILSKKVLITKDEMNIDATLIIGQKDKKLKVWLSSDYPGFDTDAIEAVTLDPKIHPELRKIDKKKFSVGPYVGIGVGEGFSLSPSFGLGIQYTVFKF